MSGATVPRSNATSVEIGLVAGAKGGATYRRASFSGIILIGPTYKDRDIKNKVKPIAFKTKIKSLKG
ncbi:hypothetical protein MY4824_005388 [Beauveria thailandica]